MIEELVKVFVGTVNFNGVLPLIFAFHRGVLCLKVVRDGVILIGDGFGVVTVETVGLGF